MATKKAKAAPAPAPVQDAAATKARGPRGVSEEAKITVLVPNPKREGSKAQAVFALYETGMTVGEFISAVDAAGYTGAATPNLVYDSKHGFIEIEGYEVPGGVLPPKEPKAPKAAKEPKAPRAKKEKAAPVPEAEVETEEEVMD